MQADSEPKVKAFFPRPGDFATDERVQYEDDAGCYVFTDPKDGVRYEYDEERSAWFPMWNESLISEQQSAYGTAEHDVSEVAHGRNSKRKNREASRARENTSIYVSGLPTDTTEEEVAEYFSQCGAIMPEIVTNSPRVKLYRNKDGALKGDALVTYYKAPSVQIAVDILDDSLFRASAAPARISVQKAEFRERTGREAEKEHGNINTDTSKRSRVDTKLVKKRLGQLEKKLDWTEDVSEVADRHRRTVILKHMFTVEELEEDVTLLLDLTEDVRAECEKLGAVASIKIFDTSDEGVIAVKFKSEAVAKACVKTMDGRFFAGRQVEADIYDGHTRYKASSKARSEPNDAGNTQDGDNGDEERMEKYAQWLDSGQ